MFSVIIPNFNREKAVIKAISSVLDQTYKDFEIIVVDDCSTDNSLERIAEISDSRIRVFKLGKNSGAAAARNYGIIKSRAGFISFLDSDDTFEKDFLKVSYETLSNTDENIGFMWTGSNFIQNGKIRKQIWKPKRKETPHLTFLNELKIGTGAGVTMKRVVFQKCGDFNKRLPAAEDTDFFLRITQNFDYVYAAHHLINIHRDGGDRMSKNFKNIALAYNTFLPTYFSLIDKDKNLKTKFYYKMMWLNYHIKNKKLARLYFRKTPKSEIFMSLKIIFVFLLYEIFSLPIATKIHFNLAIKA